jgi:hypothetical protein
VDGSFSFFLGIEKFRKGRDGASGDLMISEGTSLKRLSEVVTILLWGSTRARTRHNRLSDENLNFLCEDEEGETLVRLIG